MRTLRSGLLTRSGTIVRRGSEVLGLLLTRYAPSRHYHYNSCANTSIQGILQLHFQFKRVCVLPFTPCSVLTIRRSITASDCSRRALRYQLALCTMLGYHHKAEGGTHGVGRRLDHRIHLDIISWATLLDWNFEPAATVRVQGAHNSDVSYETFQSISKTCSERRFIIFLANRVPDAYFDIVQCPSPPIGHVHIPPVHFALLSASSGSTFSSMIPANRL